MPARAGSHARPASLPAAPAPFTSSVLQDRSRTTASLASQPLPHSCFSPPALERRAPHEVLPPAPPPARTSEAVPGRPALIGCLPGAPPLCTRRRWGGPRSGRARRGPAGEASVTRVPASASGLGRPRGGGGRRRGCTRAGDSRGPEGPPHPLTRRRSLAGASRASRRDWELPEGPSSSPAR